MPFGQSSRTPGTRESPSGDASAATRVLVDVEDVAAGSRTLLRWNDEEAWVRSPGVAHEPLITPELFEAARTRRAANGRTTIRKPRRTPRPYLLRGLL